MEETLSAVDEELAATEDALTEWSSSNRSRTPSSQTGTGTGTPSTGTPSSGSQSLSSASLGPIGAVFQNVGLRLSTITERTESNSRPTSYAQTGSRPNSQRLSAHVRGATDPGPSNVPPARRAGQLIAFFEEKGPSPFAPSPAGPRSPSPYAFRSRSSSPNKSATTNSGSYSGTPYTQSASVTNTGYDTRSPSGYSGYTGHTGTASQSGSGYTASGTGYTATNTGYDSRSATFSSLTPSGSSLTPVRTSSLRRTPAGGRSPLTSVRNIVAAWKDRTPADTATSISRPTQPSAEFGMRRRAGRRSNEGAGDQTPRTESSAGLMPPPLDLNELGQFTKAGQEVHSD